MTKVSIYRNACDPYGTTCTLEEILQNIKFGYYRNQVNIVRSRQNKDDYRKEKKKLPMFTASGVFSYRDDYIDRLSCYSNIIVADFDHFNSRNEALAFKAKLIQYANPLHLASVFESPGGLGVKALLLHDNKEPMEHTRLFQQIKRDLFPNTLEFDMNCGNLSRTCFVSYDPDLFINRDSGLQPYHFIPDETILINVKKERHQVGNTQKPFVHTDSQLFWHKTIDMKEKLALGLKRDSDLSLMDWMKRKWDVLFPEAYEDGNRHRSILSRGKSFCEAGILMENATHCLVQIFTRHGISEEEIVNMVNYCYNTSTDSWGASRGMLFDMRMKGRSSFLARCQYGDGCVATVESSL